jgi:exosortase/archaeosortase family protein
MMNTKKSFINSVRSFFTEPQWGKLRGILWFCLLTMIIHIAWRLWANSLNFYPVQDLVNRTEGFLVDNLIKISAFIISHILNIDITVSDRSIITGNHIRLILKDSASGLKQMIQFALLIMIFPGPWKRKGWFIPLGMIIVYLTNIFRMICLVIVAIHWPLQIHYAHDNWLKILFYVAIFALWLVWVEKISIRKAKT